MTDTLPVQPRIQQRWLVICTAAACFGFAILILGFGKLWPTGTWTLHSRAELIEQGHQISVHFGVDTTGWQTLVTSDLSKTLLNNKRDHPQDAYARTLSPLSVRILFVHPGDHKTAEAGFNSTGAPLFWSAPKDFPGAMHGQTDEAAANSAFRLLAAANASAFQAKSGPISQEDKTERYSWVRPDVTMSGFRPVIEVDVSGGVVKRAALRFPADTDEDLQGVGGDSKFWDVLNAIFGFLCFAGMVAMLGICVQWMVRKELSYRFPLILSGGGLLLLSWAFFFGSGGEDMWLKYRRADDLDVGSALGMIVLAAIAAVVIAAGRSISVEGHKKWISLEELCGLSPVSQMAGRSLAAGIFFSPVLAALPFLLAGSGLFARCYVDPHGVGTIYSRFPLVESLGVPVDPAILGFFGFFVPALTGRIRTRWVRAGLITGTGALFFSAVRTVTNPFSAALLSGLLLLGLFWLLYSWFDLLAVLVMQVAGGLITTLMIVWQGPPSAAISGSLPILLALAGPLVIAFWIIRKGRLEPVGDPRATFPAVTGYRAEREKLKAEFSVARRAQQGMLPQTAPVIPGYSLAASCTPSLEVGGDLYDFLRVSDGRVGIGVADVSGKGVPAALYMTLTKGLLTSTIKHSSHLPEVMEEVNRHLHTVTRKKVFVTMALGFLDPQRRHLQYVRAGHNPIVWRQPARLSTTLVAPNGMGLGITAGRVFGTQLKTAEMELEEGDAVVFYSDGITEAMNSSLEQFGEQRLMDAVERTDHLDATAAHDSILSEVRAFLNGVHPQDDMTLVVLRVSGSTAEPAIASEPHPPDDFVSLGAIS